MNRTKIKIRSKPIKNPRKKRSIKKNRSRSRSRKKIMNN